MRPTTPSPQVVVVGSVNQDVVLTVPSLPRPGETVLATASRSGTGGKGANQAVAAARAGAQTWFVGAFGADTSAEHLRSALAVEGIRLDAATRSARPSGRAIVLVDERGNNCIVVDQGANADLDSVRVAEILAGLRPGDVLVVQCELSADSVESALRAGSDAGAIVVLNLAPFRSFRSEVLRGVSVLVVNEGEAAALAGPDASLDAPAEIAQQLASVYGCACVITLGDQGSFTSAGGPAVHVPAEHVENVVDTTGAGDAFVGVLAARLAGGDPLIAAVRTASAAAARTVQALGAQTLPTAGDLAQAPALRRVEG